MWMRGFFGPWLSTTIADLLFLIRVNALYAWNKKVVAFTSFLWLATFASGLTLIILEISQTPVMDRPPGFPLPGCLATVPPNADKALIGWIVALIATFSYFFLTFRKFMLFAMQLNVGDHRQTNLQTLASLKRLAPTMHLFFRDGAFYFTM
ncbi:hypothetical protein HGRIS_007130 [Hohenbuehelia grisea]|uniref:Uncharacterized protein n=1 Tax=Hohenbuehelia grisea TaxID=104357 RepID=A0ABR3JCS8_9AGAR